VHDLIAELRTKSRISFQDALTRFGRYVPRMEAVLRREGVPIELAYLPVVESGYRNQATSHAGTAGPWRFPADAGRRYGLRIDHYVDERHDPVSSTRAAARYLTDLHTIFGSWLLVLVAYNIGPTRLSRIMRLHGARTFWDMAAEGRLPAETSGFVQRFLAAISIARAPAAHGFEESSEPVPSYDLVRVNDALSFESLAEFAGVPAARIAELNPALVRRRIPPWGYRVRLPRGTGQRFEAAARDGNSPRVTRLRRVSLPRRLL
jgi:membrane-bound lytic murein transglycosylase D